MDGEVSRSLKNLERLTAKLPTRSLPAVPQPSTTLVNFVVNNEGDYFPRISASHTGQNSSPAKLIDGNYWYHVHPPNRWTAAGSNNERDWITIDLGVSRRIHTLKLYFLDDDADIVPPASYEIEYWQDDQWQPLPKQERTPRSPAGRRPNVIRFPEMAVTKL